MNIHSSSKNVFSISATDNHIVQVCQNEIVQTEVVAQYIKEGLLKNEAVVVIATPTLRKAVIAEMYALGLDIETFKSEGQIKFFDAEFALLSLLMDGDLDNPSFHKIIDLPIQALKLKYGKVRVMGEMVDVLWKQGDYATAVELENQCNEISLQQGFTILCTYLLNSLDSNTLETSLELICKYHNDLITPGNYYDSFKPAVNNPIWDGFRTAWIHAVNQLTDSSQIPSQPVQVPKTL